MNDERLALPIDLFAVSDTDQVDGVIGGEGINGADQLGKARMVLAIELLEIAGRMGVQHDPPAT
jgi:hypothetical protein